MEMNNGGLPPISTGKTESLHSVEGYTQQTRQTSSVTTGSKDIAKVSEKALLLSKSYSSLESVPDVRTEQVDAIKQSIADGTYSVSPEKLASVLLKYLNLG